MTNPTTTNSDARTATAPRTGEAGRGPLGWAGRALDAARRQFKHRRRGSVLILVVALLVLMALIGTAFITSAGTDRDASVQHRYNTQVEMLLKGVEDLAVDQVVRQVAAVDPPQAQGTVPNQIVPAPTFRPPSFGLTPWVTNPPDLYNAGPFQPPLEYRDVVYAPWDRFLADRYPRSNRANPVTDPTTVTAVSLGGWDFVSASPLAVPRDPAYPNVSIDQFASPLVTPVNQFGPAGNAPVVGRYHSRLGLMPASVSITSSTGVSRAYPALQIIGSDVQSHPNPYVQGTYRGLALAADADGDGIADAPLFELPIGQVDGVRYYGAIRIIDNAAAINASIAMENSRPGQVGDETSRLQADVFPTNVDLRTLVRDPSDPANELGRWNAFNSYRFNDGYGTTYLPNYLSLLTPVREPTVPVTSQAAGFEFATRYDALWGLLGSRLDNPGLNYAGRRAQPLGITESVNLAYRGGMVNALGSTSELEKNFPKAFRQHPALLRQYGPAEYQLWFREVYDYDLLTSRSLAGTYPYPYPARPLTVAHNAVSNYVPSFTLTPPPPNTVLNPNEPPPLDPRRAQADTLGQEYERGGKYRFRGSWTDAPSQKYRIGEWVRFAFTPVAPGLPTVRSFVCVRNHQSNNSNLPYVNGVGPNLAFWAEAPWASQPTKVNPNTASFGQLMAAYNAVMGDGPEVKLPEGADAAHDPDADPEYQDPSAPTAAPPQTTEAYDLDKSVFTFGNVMRPLGTAPVAPLPPRYVKQLRAALAAVNTIDVRDPDDTVTSRTVVMADDAGTNPITARVYGTERQLFITMAMVHVSELDQPYVLLELYNPYPVTVSSAPYVLAWRERGPNIPATPALQLVEISTLSGQPIPPGGYVWYESNPALRPVGLTVPPTTTALPGLDQVATNGNRELLLMRTRRADGQMTASIDPANTFSEADASGGKNLIEWVPADNLEFVGIGPGLNRIPNPMAPNDPTQSIPAPFRYHYRRATAPAGNFVNRWHSVYGGAYSRVAPTFGAAAERRQRGFVRDPKPTVDPMTSLLVTNFSQPGFGDKGRMIPTPTNTLHNDGTYNPAEATFRTRSLQVNNTGFGGPWKQVFTNSDPDYNLPPGSAGGNPAVSAFPLGGFARNGDILQVPFVGGYRIDSSGVIELNSISLDAAWAEDGDQQDDDEANGTGAGNPLEQLGRFCPIVTRPGKVMAVDDLVLRPSPVAPLIVHRYAWATDLFDYLSVVAPQDDYLPNVDPTYGRAGTPLMSGDPTVTQPGPQPENQRKWVQGNRPVASADPPQPVANGRAVTNTAVANIGNEESAATHGLINLNTASWRVIAQLPFTPNAQSNTEIAHAIVLHRERYGPYRNLFDLLKVRVGDTAYGAPKASTYPVDTYFADLLGPAASNNPQTNSGDLSPYAETAVSPPVYAVANNYEDDQVFGDFEARYLTLTRISNMVTFRSDSFTAYVVVQGWRNAGTRTPELVVQRRSAMIIDRSQMKPLLNGFTAATGMPVSPPVVTNVPNN